MKTLRIASLFVVVASLSCGVDSALVGGRCRDGFVLNASGDACVPEPLSTEAPELPKSGVLPAPTSSSQSAVSPGPTATAITGPSVIPSAPVDGGVVELPEQDASVDASVDAPVDAPADGPEVALCESPKVECRGACVTLAPDDPWNCGACGKVCPSNICVAGECQGATPGDVVLIGHDYASVWSGSAYAKVLTNAVSIPTTDPIRVLVYEAGAPAGTAAHVRAALGAGIRRKVSFTTGDAAALESATLAQSYDVVLVHDAAGDDPAALGARWAGSLDAFTKKGGVVVALDGAASDMPSLLASAGLLSVTSHAPLDVTSQFLVAAPYDVVGAQVLSPYAASGASVAFVGAPAEDADHRWVVREKTEGGAGLPVVVHRVVR